MTTITLKSKVKNVPDLVLGEDDEKLSIGRNAKCKITNPFCPMYHVVLKRDSDNDQVVLAARYPKTKEEKIFKEGDVVEGPGYEYLISFSNESAKKRKLESSAVWTFDKEANVHVCHYMTNNPSSKIAAFDFDATLSNPKSGAKFPKDGNDFQILSDKLPSIISSFCSKPDGHRFVIFSNQLGIAYKKTKLEHVQARIEGILEVIGDIPCIAFVAIGENMSRKPLPGMFHLLEDKFNDGIKIDIANSFYVGDAAGRKTAARKDHSAADLLFAINVGLPFQTPEQFLKKEPIKPISEIDMSSFTLPEFNPRSLRSDDSTFGIEEGENDPIKNSKDFEDKLVKIDIENASHKIVTFVGLPGSGKSTFFDRFFKPRGYIKVSRDELKTMDKVEKQLRSLLSEAGKEKMRIVVDNTNTEVALRKRWLSIGKEFKATSMAIYFNVTADHAIHNNSYRWGVSMAENPGQTLPTPVPKFVIRKQAKDLVIPTKSEGFAHVFKVNFVPHFANPRHADLYYMYLSG